jgi:predicted acylesterase/phospholipase RssA
MPALKLLDAQLTELVVFQNYLTSANDPITDQLILNTQMLLNTLISDFYPHFVGGQSMAAHLMQAVKFMYHRQFGEATVHVELAIRADGLHDGQFSHLAEERSYWMQHFCWPEDNPETDLYQKFVSRLLCYLTLFVKGSFPRYSAANLLALDSYEFCFGEAWVPLQHYIHAVWFGRKPITNRNFLEAVTSLYSGPVGLALSGGGMRAAFTHLGMLAFLAEAGYLRRVEVISCVSGGSVIGGLYYTLVRQLLESKSDNDITNQDYVEIVQHMIRHTSKWAETNIYMKTLANPFKNFGVGISFLCPTYLTCCKFCGLCGGCRVQCSRTRGDLMASQYEDLFMAETPAKSLPKKGERRREIREYSYENFKPTYLNLILGDARRRANGSLAFKEKPKEKESEEEQKARWENNDLWRKVVQTDFRLKNLPIMAKGERIHQRPRTYNWRRIAKVPQLFINCTTLNTGNLWFFSEEEMGESKVLSRGLTGAVSTFDAAPYRAFDNVFLRNTPLQAAVAASAAVPGVFKPMTLNDGYTLGGDQFSVKLTDGGVFQNDGMMPLYLAGAKTLIVSGGGAESVTHSNPSTDALAVLNNTLSITMEQIYQRAYRELRSRSFGGQIRSFIYVTLNDFACSDETEVPRTHQTVDLDGSFGSAIKRFAAQTEKAIVDTYD